MEHYFSREESIVVANELLEEYAVDFDSQRHRFVVSDTNHEPRAYFRLPLSVAVPFAGTVEDIDTIYAILLVQSGSCAMGLFEGTQMIDHKVFKSYMVRKKQGKSQIKYLKTKGKSRAGSRVRLANTEQFFDDIQDRFSRYEEDYQVEHIAFSCSKTLYPYLFSSESPLQKDDDRLIKIPKHLHTPNFEVLNDAYQFLNKGHLTDLTENKEFESRFL